MCQRVVLLDLDVSLVALVLSKLSLKHTALFMSTSKAVKRKARHFLSTETRVKLKFNAIMSKHVKASLIHQDEFECAFETTWDQMDRHLYKLERWLMNHIPIAEVCGMTMEYRQHTFTNSHSIRAEDEPTVEEQSDLDSDWEGYGGEYHVIQTFCWKIEYSFESRGFFFRQQVSKGTETEIQYDTRTDDTVFGLAHNLCSPSYIEPLQVVKRTQRNKHGGLSTVYND